MNPTAYSNRRFNDPGPWLVIAAATLWGTTGTAQALAPPGATANALGVFRLVGGALILLTVATRRGVLTRSAPWPLLWTLLAGVAIAAYQPLFFAGVGRAGVAIGTIVGIGSAPIIAGLLDVLVERQRPMRRWLVATGLGLLGCGLLVLPGADSASADVGGLLLATGAGAAYAVYTLASKRLIERDIHPDAAMAVAFTIGSVLLIPTLLTTDLSWLPSLNGLAVMLWLSLIATGLSYLLFGRGLRTVAPSTAVSLTLAEPLTAGMLGVLVVGERLTPIMLVGVGLLLAGLSLLTVFRQSQHNSTTK